MESDKVLLSDDERLAFAVELGWVLDAEPDAEPAPAEEYFTLEALEEAGYEAQLEGVTQPLLDEVRDAVLRRSHE